LVVSESEDEPVPKLPRGRGLKLSGPELFRIGITLISLIGVIVLAKPCASSVSSFVMGYSQGSDASKLPKPGTVEPTVEDYSKYEQLRPGMTDEEIKAAIERSKARNAAEEAGSAGRAGSAGSGSSAP
jgi:hypothetical protein